MPVLCESQRKSRFPNHEEQGLDPTKELKVTLLNWRLVNYIGATLKPLIIIYTLYTLFLTQ